jgi:hypothetical protein
MITVLLVPLAAFGRRQEKYSQNDTQDAGKTECRLNFTLKSWSVFYKSGKGYRDDFLRQWSIGRT